MLKSAQEKASVTTKRNSRGLLAKQGEFNGVKELLLCAVPEVTERKECSDFFGEMTGMKLPEAYGTLNPKF